jgi:peptidoglycan hydrolase CwlO-like protein
VSACDQNILNRCTSQRSYYLALRYYTNLCCSFQRENDELKYQIHTLEQEQQVLKQTITGLQWDILQLKKEMSETESERVRERDSIVQNKVKNL